MLNPTYSLNCHRLMDTMWWKGTKQEGLIFRLVLFFLFQMWGCRLFHLEGKGSSTHNTSISLCPHAQRVGCIGLKPWQNCSNKKEKGYAIHKTLSSFVSPHYMLTLDGVFNFVPLLNRKQMFIWVHFYYFNYVNPFFFHLETAFIVLILYTLHFVHGDRQIGIAYHSPIK